MSKKKKELTKEKANLKQSNKETKKRSTDTWVETTYNLSSAFRVGKMILSGAHPATYFNMAKHRIAIPLLEKYTSETVQVVAHLTSEVVEWIINPPVYAVNKATAIIGSLSGHLIKTSLNIQHPELRAVVDVTCKEAAHQTTNRFFKPATHNKNNSGYLSNNFMRSKL